MKKQVNVTFLPQNKKVQVRLGTTVLLAASRAGIRIAQRCGGNASCLMCKVIVDEQRGLSPVNQKEQLKLDSLLAANYRLSCQAQLLADTIVKVPEDPLKTFIRAQLEGKNDD